MDALKLISLPGELVLDPFIGSGSSAIAALNTNRKIIGIDSKKEYLPIFVLKELMKAYENTRHNLNTIEGFLK